MSSEQHGFPANKGLSYRAIEGKASKLREALGFRTTDAVPGIELFERLGHCNIIVSRQKIPLSYAVNDLPEGIEALTMYDKTRQQIIVVLSPDTYDLLECEQPRARFSLCHEIAHAVLHPRELMRFSEIPHKKAALFRGEAPDHPVYRDTEWQAHSFAASFLMPAKGIERLEEKHGVRAKNLLTQHFKVSSAAANLRWRIYSERKQELLR